MPSFYVFSMLYLCHFAPNYSLCAALNWLCLVIYRGVSVLESAKNASKGRNGIILKAVSKVAHV